MTTADFDQLPGSRDRAGVPASEGARLGQATRFDGRHARPACRRATEGVNSKTQSPGCSSATPASRSGFSEPRPQYRRELPRAARGCGSESDQADRAEPRRTRAARRDEPGSSRRTDREHGSSTASCPPRSRHARCSWCRGASGRPRRRARRGTGRASRAAHDELGEQARRGARPSTCSSRSASTRAPTTRRCCASDVLQARATTGRPRTVSIQRTGASEATGRRLLDEGLLGQCEPKEVRAHRPGFKRRGQLLRQRDQFSAVPATPTQAETYSKGRIRLARRGLLVWAREVLGNVQRVVTEAGDRGPKLIADAALLAAETLSSSRQEGRRRALGAGRAGGARDRGRPEARHGRRPGSRSLALKQRARLTPAAERPRARNRHPTRPASNRGGALAARARARRGLRHARPCGDAERDRAALQGGRAPVSRRRPRLLLTLCDLDASRTARAEPRV